MAELKPYGAATANGWERTGAGCGKVEFTGAGSGKVDIYIDCIATSQKKEKTTAENLSANKWINVKDRLPENPEERVLVKVGCEQLVNGKPSIDTDRCQNYHWVRYNGFVTHWMPLPGPPKGE